jgi:peroxiredoxin Q/BCP
MLEPGTPAPGFTLPSQSGERVSLSSLRGRWVVLYFFPRAATPGCTVQACGIRDHRADYDAAGATVLGISTDPVAKLERFADSERLDFPLLSDEDHAVHDAYGTWVEKKNYGRTYWGTQRATFVIDPEGVVRHVIARATPKTHDDKVLAALGELAA